MTNRNKLNGNAFERELAETLSQRGWWAHVMQQSKNGQPADLIVANRKATALIDCKLLDSTNSFPFSRIEPNQWYAMARFKDCTGIPGYLAIRMKDGQIRLVKMTTIELLAAHGNTTMNYDELTHLSQSLDEWCRYYQ